MPLKVWSLDDGALTSSILTNWTSTSVKEAYRPQAEELDSLLDHILDRAVRFSDDARAGSADASFTKAWAVGKALDLPALQAHTAMQGEEIRFLWLVLAAKCRLGARSDGTTEPTWQSLRPAGSGAGRLPRREQRGRLDYFDMCVWLAEEPAEVAAATFGSSVRNAWQMFERPTLRAPIVRSALREWVSGLNPVDRLRVQEPQTFAGLMKALRSRWPARGPGSARQPVHMSAWEVRSTIAAIGPTVLGAIDDA
jgi:hypothetical protein